MTYREIPEDRVLEFPATPGFKEWEPFFTEESTTHPAKMNLNLLRWILETYTEPGEVILDPMAGTGSTIILASILGRHGVAVEYELRFCDMIRANIELTERQATLTSKGRMICIQGDARKLSKLLKESDAIVTSPPYSDVIRKKGGETKLEEIGVSSKSARKYSLDPDNIGNLPHGDIDTIVTSPPYGEAQSGGGIAVKGYDGPKHSPTDLVGKRSYMPDKFEGEENISHLKYGESVDAVITSPPYSEGTGHGGGPASEKLTLEKKLHLTGSEAYSKPVDAVVTSPPYEGSEVGKAIRPNRWEKIKDREGFKGRKEWRTGTPIHYSEASDNIGNLKSETYLQAMLQVYSECYKVLKPEGGKLIVVVKNFIRDKKVVRLDLDTIRLCEAAGFTLMDHWYFKLPTRSFWRILYHKKHPEVPEVEFEDVLVFDKGVDIPGGKVKG